MSFDLRRIEAPPKSYYANVLLFTTGAPYGSSGNRNPGVWFDRNTNNMFISSSVNGNHDKSYMINTIPTDRFTNYMVVQHQTEAGKYVYRIFINGNQVMKTNNPAAREYQNVKVYMSESDKPTSAIVRNFVYSNLE